MSDLMMNTREVAEYLDIHEKQVYSLIKEKKIPCTRVTGKWIFPKYLIDEWIASSAKASIDYLAGQRTHPNILLAAGSNDPILDILLGSINLSGEFKLFSTSTGSTQGLKLLGEKQIDIAWCHLLDPETGEYNIPYLSRYLPGMNIAVVHMFYRQIGFIYSASLDHEIKNFDDISTGSLRFINRQGGSGTRLLLDYHLQKNGISPEKITGYENEVCTHFETGLAIASHEADLGIGTVATAKIFGLKFTPIVRESFDMVLSKDTFFFKGVQVFIEMLNSETFRKKVAPLGNYDFSESGKILFSAP